MKQIIVNVSGLSEEEKQSVNEALAKITGFNKMTSNLFMANWMYAPSTYHDDQITYSNGNEPGANKGPTHTPQQVLEMAVMTENRKVRADFDKRKKYSVDVSNCTVDEKKKVQQAFFDAGFPWEVGGKEYRRLDAWQYSNTTGGGHVTEFCMHGLTIKECNMSPEEFFSFVYEPEKKGHVHAELMAQYAEDAKTTDKPWELWQFLDLDGNWVASRCNPIWAPYVEYRRKPKTNIVNGVEVPDLRIEAKEGDRYYLVDLTERDFNHYYVHVGDALDSLWVSRGLCYEPTMEGKQAAILHAKSMLGIA